MRERWSALMVAGLLVAGVSMVAPSVVVAQDGAEEPAAAAVSADATIVDELDDSFIPSGAGWRDGEGGYGDHHYWQRAVSARTGRVGTWRVTLPEAGPYRVEAMVPLRHATTKAARYLIGTAEGIVIRTVNQSRTRGTWVSLGTYELGATAEVRLSARTADARAGRMVAFDAMRFVSVAAPPSPPDPPVISNIDVEAQPDRAVVRFSLDAKGPARTEYRVADAVDWRLGANEASSQHADHRQVVTGLRSQTDYELRVIATNDGGTTVSDIVRFTTTAPSPPVVSRINVDPEDTRAVVTFSLDAKGPAKTEYREVGAGTWLVGAEEKSSDYKDHRQVITGLRPETRYELRVVATNAGGTTTSDAVAFPTQVRTVDCGTGGDLQRAIDRASAGDTILVMGRCVGTFRVLKDLTIIGGPGAVLDAGGGDWALLVGSIDGTGSGIVWGVNLTVRNLTIAGGREFALNSWGNVHLRDVVVRGSEGSGIYNESVVTVQRSTIRGNARSGYTSGSTGSLNVIDSVFQDNGGSGIDMSDGGITISGSTVTGNGGPGIRCVAQSGIDMTDTTVAGNAGGGLHIEYCPGRITDSMIVENRTSGDGGGIWVAGWIDEGYAPRIERSVIRDNQAAGRGGGIFNAKPSPDFLGPLVVVDTTISGNTARAGGGIYSEEEMTLTRVTFSGNAPDGCVGIGCP